MELNINKISFNNQVIKNQKVNQTKKTNLSIPIQRANNLPLNMARIPFGNSDYKYKSNDFLLPRNNRPDIYQMQAASAIEKGNNVVVTAPTGTGKTAIAYFAIKKNFENNQKTFYTTPLKALSNQKYNDLKELFGSQCVGILTGDRKENTRAPIVVMTTEIYRNMVESNYFDKKNKMLDNLKTVIFDEFHYMGDPDRGTVWEESIMYTPKKTQILALSATVGNNKKITNWIGETKGNRISLVDVPQENRHVPLEYVIIETNNKEDDIPDEIANKLNRRQLRKAKKAAQAKRPRNPMVIIEQIRRLQKTDKLPAISFVFSKSYSQKLLDLAEAQGVDLTSKEEKDKITKIIDKYIKEYDLYSTNLNLEAMLKGYAIHSAAILPLQKQLVEELFNKKLIKVVFATETLAAGINMPARTVIMTDAQKPSSSHDTFGTSQNFLRPLSANEFHQMTGRAGRRGIDKIGYAVLLSDSNEKTEIFDNLITSSPDRVNSSYKIDASSVAGFYNHFRNPKDMDKILNKSFSLYGLTEVERENKYNEHMKTFADLTKLLKTYNFIETDNYGYKTTPKGSIINSIKGKPQIPIVNALLKKEFCELSPTELAGILASMSIEPCDNEPMLEMEQTVNHLDASNLKKINNDINKMLKNDFYIDINKTSSKDTNDTIITTVEDRHINTLRKDSNKLYEEKETLTKEITIKENERIKLGFSKERNNEIGNLYVKLKKVKADLSVKYKFKRLKELLEKRIGLEAYQYETSEKRLLNVYDKLDKSFSKYNKNVMELKSPNIPLAQLNPTTMLFVKKWAQLNAESHDYIKNWNVICEMLKDTGSVRYEGDLFNAISQTIDFIHQFQDAVSKAEQISEDYEEQIEYNNLKEKCKAVVKLLKHPPLYNSEEI